MTDLDAAAAIAYARHRLDAMPAAHLTYHRPWHTFGDVIPAVLRLGTQEHVGPAASVLLEVAAAFHDLGFPVQREGHEAIGVEMAWEALPDFGFSAGAIAQIEVCILATRIPQMPGSALAAILADADLDVLGRADFWQRSEELRQENEYFDGPIEQLDWLRRQLAFLDSHRYFTRTARALRDKGKAANARRLRQALAPGQLP